MGEFFLFFATDLYSKAAESVVIGGLLGLLCQGVTGLWWTVLDGAELAVNDPTVFMSGISSKSMILGHFI